MTTPATPISRYEFFLQDLQFGLGDDVTRNDTGFGGVRDCISFELNKRPWKLRQLVSLGEQAGIPADTAYHLFKTDNRPAQLSTGAMLQTPSDGITEEEAGETADEIGWLLGLALGRNVSWYKMEVREDHGSKFVRRRTTRCPGGDARLRPIDNVQNRSIKSYLETAYPIFALDSEWWKKTIDWFVCASESRAIEASGVVLSMLLDRCCSQILKAHEYEFQIGEDLYNNLKNRATSKNFKKSLTTLFSLISSNWGEDRSNRLIETVKKWNKEPPYPQKIEIAFTTIGIIPPAGKIIHARHELMHTGNLNDFASLNVGDYYEKCVNTSL